MSEDVLEVTDEDFEAEVLKSDLPVVVDMWAPWCGPCLMVGPIIEQLGRENTGKIKVCKLNVDVSPQVAARFGITAIPTVLLLKDGQEAGRLIGVQPRARYQEAIDGLTGA